MKTIKGIISGLLSIVLAFIILIVLSSIIMPETTPMFTGIAGLFWQVFKAFFAEDIIRTLIIAAVVAMLFGSISYKQESIIVALIGAVIDIVILFAGFGGK